VTLRSVPRLVFWLAVLLVLGRPDLARADARFEGLLAPHELTWCGDQEGGGPYVYPADDDPNRVIGFEVDLADQIAARLGLRAKFSQGQWDKMPELLHTKKCDIVLNGYEWMPSRLETMEASVPYYIYGLQLLARTEGDIKSWTDLEKPGDAKRKIGVLVGSAAEQYLTQRLGSRVEIVSYDGSTDAMREVETKKLDATLQDTPAAVFYRPRFPALSFVGDPVGRGYYVVYAKKGDTKLVHAINEALVELIARGKLESLYRSYGIWNDAQRELFSIADAARFYGFPVAPAAPSASVDAPASAKTVTAGPAPIALSAKKHGLEVVAAYGLVLLQSAGLTIVLSCLSFPVAVALGLLVALGRLYGPTTLRAPLGAYVEFLRGTPVMLQLYFIFFFLPEVGINVPAFWTAILGLSVNYSAYESEIYRAGLLAVPKGQMEAALALGMSRSLALRRIIVPQAVRIVVPPVVNDFIALFKDTSVCSVVTLVELTKRFSVLSQSTQATAELMIMTAVLYLAMSYPLSLVARRLELRFGKVAA
jgi:polar amino acid transport system substrate-binding protein